MRKASEKGKREVISMVREAIKRYKNVLLKLARE